MPDLDDYPVPLLCEACRQLACACATSIAGIDAWADAYLGTEAQAQDYLQGQETARRFLANLHPGTLERPRPPALWEDVEQGDTTL